MIATRWRWTSAMPKGAEVVHAAGETTITVPAGNGLTDTFDIVDAIRFGWLMLIPFPSPEAIGSFL